MIWMEETAERRGSPAGLWPEVSSVIALGMSYAPDGDPLALADRPERGRISVYAQGADYHDVVKKALKASRAGWPRRRAAGVKVFVDTAPVMEKPLAEAAGLGWQGKHTNLVSRDRRQLAVPRRDLHTLELAPDAAARERCGSCTACLAACPTDAFPAPFQLDARRCISYLTIEHKGPIPEEFRPAIGNRIYGCDDCLAVCPWNRFADAARAQPGVPAARRARRAGAGGPARARRRGLPQGVRGIADQADRARPDGAECRDRGRQQRSGGAGPGARAADRRRGSGDGGSGPWALARLSAPPAAG